LARNRVAAYLRSYLDDQGWFTDSPIPVQTRVLVDASFVRYLNESGGDLKDRLNSWEAIPLTEQQLQALETVNAMGSGLEASADNLLQKADDVVLAVLDVVADVALRTMSESIDLYVSVDENGAHSLAVDLCERLAWEGRVPRMSRDVPGRAWNADVEVDLHVSVAAERLREPLGTSEVDMTLVFQAPLFEPSTLTLVLRGQAYVETIKKLNPTTTTGLLRLSVTTDLIVPRLSLPNWVWDEPELAAEVHVYAARRNLLSLLSLVPSMPSARRAGAKFVTLADGGLRDVELARRQRRVVPRCCRGSRDAANGRRRASRRTGEACAKAFG
jgi:hypothetical protein